MTIKSYIYNLLWERIWNIGFFPLTEKVLSSPVQVQWMKHNYKEGWFADPFILTFSEKNIEILVEEYNYKKKRGRIDKLTIDPSNFELKNISVILELDTHLSFPAIFRDENKIYIYPENSENGKITIYEYDEKCETLINPVVILSEPIVDAIIKKIDNYYYIFGTFFGSLNDNDKLIIYKSNNLFGPYSIYNSLIFGNYTARGGGDWFHRNGKWIRPCQDGSDLNEYGRGLVFYNFNGLDKKPIFKELSRLYPKDKTYYLGMHTFNIHKDIVVTDGVKYRRPLLAKLTQKIKKYLF